MIFRTHEETPVRLRLAAIVFPLLFGCGLSAHAAANDLPDACGSDAVKFKTTLDKPAHPPDPPSDGMAQIVFVQTSVTQGITFMNPGTSDFTTRFGLDGAWAGAAANNSYFSVNVAPGLHHICASAQGSSSAAKRMIAADSFTAEAGHVYYFVFAVQRIAGNSIGDNYYDSKLTSMNSDEGRFRVKSLSVSTSKPGK